MQRLGVPHTFLSATTRTSHKNACSRDCGLCPDVTADTCARHAMGVASSLGNLQSRRRAATRRSPISMSTQATTAGAALPRRPSTHHQTIHSAQSTQSAMRARRISDQPQRTAAHGHVAATACRGHTACNKASTGVHACCLQACRDACRGHTRHKASLMPRHAC